MTGRAFATLAIALSFATPMLASEAAREDRPASESVKEGESPMRRSIEEIVAQETIFPRLRDRLADSPPFVRDMELMLQIRTYPFLLNEPTPSFSDVVDPNGGLIADPGDLDLEPYAWALGGSLAYRSGLLWEIFSVGTTLFTSQPLSADDPFAKTGVLQTRNRGYTVFGELWGKAEVNEHSLRGGRVRIDWPFINASDSRMTPNTFEAYLFTGEVTELSWLRGAHYVFGWIDKVKSRTATTFESMSEAAGAEGTSMGLFPMGFVWNAGESFQIGALNYFVKDTLNILYTETDALLEIGDDAALRLQIQGALQDSVGIGLLTGGERFSTRLEQNLRDGIADGLVNGIPIQDQIDDAFRQSLQGVVTRSGGQEVGSFLFGAQLSGSFMGGTLRIAATKVGPTAGILNPYGTYPGFTGMMQTNFNRAGELGVVFGFSFVASELGLPELSGFINYGIGRLARDPVTNDPLPNQRNLDVTFDYKVEKGFLRGFWLRTRGSLLRLDRTSRSRGSTRKEIRIILNYDIPVL